MTSPISRDAVYLTPCGRRCRLVGRSDLEHLFEYVDSPVHFGRRDQFGLTRSNLGLLRPYSTGGGRHAARR